MTTVQNERLDDRELAEALSRIQHERGLRKAGFVAVVLLAAGCLFGWTYLSYNSTTTQVSPGVIGVKSMEWS